MVFTTQIQATQLIEFILRKAKLFDQFKDKLYEMQAKVVD
jgi:hypothetical protein